MSVQLQKILGLLVSFSFCVFAHRENSLHNHGFEMEYSDLKLLCINDDRDSFRIARKHIINLVNDSLAEMKKKEVEST